MEESLLVLLGVFASLVVGLLGILGVVWKRNGHNVHADHNPNFDTMDNKLNQILIILTKIEAKLGS